MHSTERLRRWLLPILLLLCAGSVFAQGKSPGTGIRYSDIDSEEVRSFVFGIFGVIALMVLGVVVLIIASMWKIFEKAGQPGWAALVPVYNFVIMLRVVERPEWWILLFFIPFVNVGVAVVVCLDLARVFGMEEIFAIGLIVIPYVFFPILGFGDASYIGSSTGNSRRDDIDAYQQPGEQF